MTTAEISPPSVGQNGQAHSARHETAAPDAAAEPPRVALALDAIDRMTGDAGLVRAFEEAVARLECEQDELMALWDELERHYLEDLGCLAEEIAAIGALMARYTGLIHELKGEGWVHG